MKIAIFGLGYVGCVTAACLARNGHVVVGVDINADKVELLNRGESPIIEPGLQELIASAIESGKLTATTNIHSAMEHSDLELIIVCVGTPSKPNGDLDIQYLERVCSEIAQGIREKSTYTTIVIRSTMLPGVSKSVLIPLLEMESKKTAGKDFGFCVNPEFLREGSAIIDFDNPPFTVIGGLDERSGGSAEKIYNEIEAPVFRVELGVAEMVKYASNAFHALKIVFANEIGNVCHLNGVDSHAVMDIFTKDDKLNISPKYLKPGFAFGGSCLGKDLRALLYYTRQRDLSVPMLESILPSNQYQKDRVLQTLLANGRKRVGLIGLSFKANTDDLRESPAVDLAEHLIGKGYKLSIYDREVSIAHLIGSNRAYIHHAIPHISEFLKPSLEATIESSQNLVITKPLQEDEIDDLVKHVKPNHLVIDLVHLNEKVVQKITGDYVGISW